MSIFNNLPRDILQPIIKSLKFELYLPNEVIIKAGTQGDCMFFLSSGTVAVLTPTGKEVSSLNIPITTFSLRSKEKKIYFLPFRDVPSECGRLFRRDRALSSGSAKNSHCHRDRSLRDVSAGS